MPVGGIPASDLATGVIPDVSGFQVKPATLGNSGQVLGLSANLQPVWMNQPSTSGLQPAPTIQGSSGQVLGLDNNLSPVWLTPSSGGSITDLIQIKAYSTSTFTINSGEKHGLKNTDFGITAVTGYTPIALMTATASYLTAYLAGFDISQVLTGNDFIWYKSSISAGQATNTTASIIIVFIKTEAIHTDG